MHKPSPMVSVIHATLTAQSIPVLDLRRDLPDIPECGGYVCFEGVIRNVNHGKAVMKLFYEAFASMAKKELRRISVEACERFDLAFVRVIHRTGELAIGETAVIIQVLARHRGEAFDGCRMIIDELKKSAPIWKKEFYADGTSEWTRCSEHHE